MTMTDVHLQLQLSADLERFYDLISSVAELAEVVKVKAPESAEKAAKILYKADTLADVHRVRTLDYIELAKKIDLAREEYRSILRQKEALEEQLNIKTKVIEGLRAKSL